MPTIALSTQFHHFVTMVNVTMVNVTMVNVTMVNVTMVKALTMLFLATYILEKIFP